MSKDTSNAAASPVRPRGRGAGVKRERSEANPGLSAHNDSSRQSTPASASGPEPKKRKSIPGSRGVANLTPEQLAKKRANDREAQRAIRERTKHLIDNLEARIRELTSQQPYQELQAALRAKETVEAENADIKRRLATVMAMIQPMITPSLSSSDQPAQGLPSPQQSFMPMPTAASPGPQSTTAHNMSPTPSSAEHDSPPTTADPYPHWNSSASASSAPPAPQSQAYRERLDQQRHELTDGLEMGSQRLGLGFLLDQAKQASRPNVVAHESFGYHQPHVQHAMSFHPNAPYPPSDSIDPALQHAIDPALS
ncbi:unnamed protein product [Discula destructiva]